MKIRKVLIAAACSLGLCVAMADAIAVVDVQKIMQESPSVKTMNKTLKTKFASRHAVIQKLQKQLAMDIKKLQKDQPTMSATKLQAQRKQVLALQTKLSEKQSTFSKDVMTAQTSAMKNIYGKLRAVINKIAKRSGYDLVLIKNAAVTVNKRQLDITQVVQKQFNK